MRNVPRNLLELRPVRNADWEEGEQGLAVLLIPKFRNPLLVRWLLPYLAKKHFRIKLDRLGSYLWKRCDGTASVETIADGMRQEFGDSAEPVYERIGKFIRKLEKEKFLRIP